MTIPAGMECINPVVWEAVRCPTCFAPEGLACEDEDGYRQPDRSHPARIEDFYDFVKYGGPVMADITDRIAQIVFKHVWCDCEDRRRVCSFDYHHVAAVLVAELGGRPGLFKEDGDDSRP